MACFSKESLNLCLSWGHWRRQHLCPPGLQCVPGVLETDVPQMTQCATLHRLHSALQRQGSVLSELACREHGRFQTRFHHGDVLGVPLKVETQLPNMYSPVPQFLQFRRLSFFGHDYSGSDHLPWFSLLPSWSDTDVVNHGTCHNRTL